MTQFYRNFSSQIQTTFFSERGYRWPRVWASGLLPLRLLQNQHRHDRYEISVNCNPLLSVCLGSGRGVWQRGAWHTRLLCKHVHSMCNICP